MNVFVRPPAGLSRAMYRVEKALTRYAPPGITVVADECDADVVVLHVIGYQDVPETVERVRKAGQSYAVMQYCLRSTERPHTMHWIPIWREAAVVWSYYNLIQLAHQDGESFDGLFYHAPLGVDAHMFYERTASREHTILTSGYIAETEGVHECAEAVRRVGGSHVHLGPKVGAWPATFMLDISDEQLAEAYSSCQWVAGLRRLEGFELPAAEGLLCGARPVMFDAPHYREWFGGLAEYVPEDNAVVVTHALTTLFRQGVRPVTQDEIFTARKRFDWAMLVGGFWRCVLQREGRRERTA